MNMKFSINLNADNFNFIGEVKAEKLKAKKLIDVKFKDSDSNSVRLACIKDGKPISFNRKWINSDNKIVDSDIHAFIEKDGKEIEIREYSRTKELNIMGFIKRADIDSFLIENCYEVFSDKSLLKLAEFLKDKVAVGQFAFKGFKSYMALIYPVFKKDKYVLVMALASSKKIYNHFMDMSVKEVKLEELPTMSEALISDIPIKKKRDN